MKRRTFIQKTAAGAVLLGAGALPLRAFSAATQPLRLTILHTNDVHGKWSAGLRDQIARIRQEEQQVLLFDAGDFAPAPDAGVSFDPAWMAEMGYDAVTLGNHDVKSGFFMLPQQSKHVHIPAVLSNGAGFGMLEGMGALPFHVIVREGIRIGVIGLGELSGPDEYVIGNDYTKLHENVEVACGMATRLKQEEHCDLVVCLSRLGFCYPGDRPSDILLAGRSKDIDVILGGQTHTFMHEATEVENAAGRRVYISHAGCDGLVLGRLDLTVYPGRGGELAYSGHTGCIA